MEQNVKCQKRSVLLIFAAVMCIISVSIMILTVLTPKKEIREFVPPSFDISAQAGIPSVSNEIDWQIIDAKAFEIGICGKVTANGENADIWLYNPKGNTVLLKVRIFDSNGTVLGETGLIKPNEYIQSVKLSAIPQQGAPLLLKVMAYQPNTYYSEGAVNINTYMG